MSTKSMDLPDHQPIASIWRVTIALALGTVVLVAAVVLMGQRFGAQYALFGIAGIVAAAAVIMLGLMNRGGYVVMILLLSLLAALRLTAGGLNIYAFDPILATMYLVWLGEIILGRVHPPRPTLIDLLWLILLGWLLLSAILSVHLPTALSGWLLWVRAYLIYFFTAQRLGRREIWALVWLISMTVLLEGVLSLVQFVTRTNIGSISDLVGGSVAVARQVVLEEGGTLFRVRGTLGYDTALAHWLELLVPILLSLLLAIRKGSVRAWLVAGIVLGTSAVVVTFTRGAWVGLVAGIGTVLLFNGRRILRSRRALAAIGLAMALMLIAVIPFAGMIRDRLVSSAEDTISVRANLNRAALEIIPDYPLMGIGLDNFPRAAPDYRAGYDWLSEGAEHKVHNVYLALAVEGGLPALLLFLVTQGLVVWTGWRVTGDLPARALDLGITAGMAAVLVHGLVAWGLLSYTVFPLWALLMGLLTANARSVQIGQSSGA